MAHYIDVESLYDSIALLLKGKSKVLPTISAKSTKGKVCNYTSVYIMYIGV